MDQHLSDGPTNQPDRHQASVDLMRERLAAVRSRLVREAAIRRDASVVLRIESRRLNEGLAPRPLESLVSLGDLTSHLTLSDDELKQVESAARIVEDLDHALRLSEDSAATATRHTLGQWAHQLGRADESAVALSEEITPEHSAAQHLRTLVSRPGSLDDSSWEGAIDAVGNTFGSAVAVAVMRGRLTSPITEDEQPVSDGPTAVETPRADDVDSTPDPEAAVLDRGESWLSTADPARPDVSEELAGAESHALATQPDDNVLLDENDGPSEAMGKRLAFGRASLGSEESGDWLTDVAADLVRADTINVPDDSFEHVWSTSSVGDSEVDLATGLVDAWRFLERGEAGLAHRLTLADGSVSPEVVELWAISQRIAFAHGSLAYRAGSILAEAKINSRPPAEMMLLRAALTRIALIAPETRAGVVLRSLPRSADNSAIDQLCLRIAGVGERLGGLNENPFRVANLSVERDRLSAWAASVGQQIAYEPDRPLYLRAHWSLLKLEQVATADAVERWRQQRPLEQFLASVVEPLLRGETEVLRSHRHEIERLEQLLQPMTPLCDRALLAEGEAIVRQYAHAQALAPGAAGYVPVDVVPLREELKVRRTSVRETLAKVMQADAGEPMRVAATLFDETVGDLIRYLDETVSYRPHEPTSVDLLQVELWKLVDESNAAAYVPEQLTAQQLTEYGRGPVMSLRTVSRTLERAGRDEAVRVIKGYLGEQSSKASVGKSTAFAEASSGDASVSIEAANPTGQAERVAASDSRQTDVMFDGEVTQSVLDD